MDIVKNELLTQIKEKYAVCDITAQCLINTGISSLEECEKFLYPKLSNLTNVFSYTNIDKIVTRINDAIVNDESIVIYGDYDCDGICATAILYLYLKSKGANVNYFIPNRKEDGYGLSIEGLEELTEEYLPDLLITVDCGITSVDEVDYIYEALGYDIIITDHHMPKETLPNCLIFNPHLENGEQFKDLSGAGVAFRLVEALSSFEECLKYIEIAAIATIGDVVPLIGDNRIIVKYGIKKLEKTNYKGLDMLIKSFQNNPLNAQDVSFKLVPRINALGRLEDANCLIELFEEDDAFILKGLVDTINETNNLRQQVAKKVTDEAKELLKNYDFNKYPFIVLYKEDWDIGVIGLAASKILDEFHHSVIVLSKNKGMIKGSGRSIDNINIVECVSACSEYLEHFGGHPKACGVSLKEENIQAFTECINNYLKSNCNPDLKVSVDIDAFDYSLINNPLQFVREQQLLHPFGEKNPKPIFKANVQKVAFKKMKLGSDHIIYKSSRISILGFNMADKLELLNSNISKSLYMTLDLNVYNSFESCQGVINSIDFNKDQVSEISFKNYLDTNIGEDKSCFKPEIIELKDIDSICDKNLYSTAIITYDLATFTNFNKPNFRKNAYFVQALDPLNTIYYDIPINSDLSYYKNIIFLEKPISLNAIDYMKLSIDTKVYYVNEMSLIKRLSLNLLDYSQLGNLFITIKNLIYLNPVDVIELYSLIKDKINISYNQYLVSIYIIKELGIFEINNSVLKYNNKIVNPIKNSKLYNLLLSFE